MSHSIFNYRIPNADGQARIELYRIKTFTVKLNFTTSFAQTFFLTSEQ